MYASECCSSTNRNTADTDDHWGEAQHLHQQDPCNVDRGNKRPRTLSNIVCEPDSKVQLMCAEPCINVDDDRTEAEQPYNTPSSEVRNEQADVLDPSAGSSVMSAEPTKQQADCPDVGQVYEINSSSEDELKPKIKLNDHDKKLLRKMVYRSFRNTPLGEALKRSNVRLRRQFEKRGLAKFRIASYNVLSQDLITANQYLYGHCDFRKLDWEYRKHTFLREFDYIDAAVLCLQEVNCEHYETFFEPELKARGYAGFYMKRTGTQLDGCATFYKTSVFTADSITPVKYYHQGVDVLDKHNVAIVALLSLARNPHIKVCVSNTHLLFNPRRGDIKLAQLMVLLAEIDKVACYDTDPRGRHKYHPVIICGDLNSLPYSDLHRLLVSGELRYAGQIIRHMSGQGEYGADWCLSRDFLDPEAGVTDTCQYRQVLCQRAVQYMARQVKAQRHAHGNTTLTSSDTHTVAGGSTGTSTETTSDNPAADVSDSVTASLQDQDPAIISCSHAPSPQLQDSAIVSVGQGLPPPLHAEQSTSLDTQLNMITANNMVTANNDTRESRNRDCDVLTPVSSSCEVSPSLPAYFNCVQGSGVVSHKLSLTSVYTHGYGNEREVTTNHSRANCTVDYILYSSRKDERKSRHVRAEEKDLRLLNSLQLLTDQQMSKLGGLPNRIITSDHLMLCATFVIGIR